MNSSAAHTYELRDFLTKNKTTPKLCPDHMITEKKCLLKKLTVGDDDFKITAKLQKLKSIEENE